jgi:hypothetical protein
VDGTHEAGSSSSEDEDVDFRHGQSGTHER